MLTVTSFSLGYDLRDEALPYWSRDDIFYPYHKDCRLTIDLRGNISNSIEDYQLTLKLFTGYNKDIEIEGVRPRFQYDNIMLSPRQGSITLLRHRFERPLPEPRELESYIGVLLCNGKEVARTAICVSPVPKDPSKLFQVVRACCETELMRDDKSLKLFWKVTLTGVNSSQTQIALGAHWFGGEVQSSVPRSGQHKDRDYQLVMLYPDTDVEVKFEFETSYTDLMQSTNYAFLLVMADDDLCWMPMRITLDELLDGFDKVVNMAPYILPSRYAESKQAVGGEKGLSNAKGVVVKPRLLIAPEGLRKYLEFLRQKKSYDAARHQQGLAVQNLHGHYLFTGKKGVGKMSAAQTLYKRLKELDPRIGRFVRVDAMELLDSTNGFSPKLEDYIEMHEHDFVYIQNAESLMLKGAIGSLTGIEVLANKLTITPAVRVVLSGRRGPLSELVNMCEPARALFEKQYHFEDIEPALLLKCGLNYLESLGYSISESAVQKLTLYLEQAYRLRGKTFENLNFVKHLIEERIITHLIERSVQCELLNTPDMHRVEVADIPHIEHRDAGEALAKLESLVGLTEVKRSILNHTALVKLNKRRAELGIYNKMPTMHMVFTGNPGTGKTTIAQYLGEIYHGIGVLSSGHLVETDRSKLVGQYLGETEKNTLNAIERASGGVLFIDEAYNLFVEGQDKRDFGHRVIETLLTYLSQEDSDMIVVLAGYTNEMRQLLESNPGLKSRFPYQFHFDDYTPAQLLKIGQLALDKEQYVLSSEAEAALSKYVIEEYDNKDEHFGNGRFITRLVKSHIIPAMSRRLALLPADEVTNAMLTRIEACDIPDRNVMQLEASLTDDTVIKSALEQLDAMIGLKSAKKALYNLVTIGGVLKEQGLPLQKSQNMVWKFAGNSGTGKRTVARLLGRVLQGLGVLKRGHTIVLSAEEFVGLSQPLPIIEQALTRATGGVLFLDIDSPEYKQRSFESLHLIIESKVRELKIPVAVVYAESDSDKEPVARNLAQNGITSFDNYIVFDDYNSEELLAIFKQLLQTKFSLGIAEGAEQEMKRYIKGISQSKPKGAIANARTMWLLAQSVAQIAQLRIGLDSEAALEVIAPDVANFEWRDPDLSKRVGFAAH